MKGQDISDLFIEHHVDEGGSITALDMHVAPKNPVLMWKA